MRLFRRPARAGSILSGVALLVGALATGPTAAAEGERADAPKKREVVAFPILKEFPDFEAKDLNGKPFRLSTSRAIDKDAALAGVVAAAQAAGAKDAKRETPLESIEAWKEPEARAEGLQVAATEYGLVIGAETAAGWKTLGDVADWVAGASEAPIVFVVWSSKCPTSKAYEPRLLEAVAATGARVFPLASNAIGETDEEAKGYVEAQGLPYRVLVDRDQAVCDKLGGTRTPHVFLLDKRNRLRYAGAIDDDPAMEKDDAAARRNYLLEALVQVKDGREVDVWVTAPKG
jgi:hypothetical protein